jgi:hypothetical protein
LTEEILLDQSCQSISFYTSLPLIKWPVLLAWASSEPLQACWAYLECHWFIKIDANLHQFALTKGGCTKIKLMQKAPSSGILHRLHQNYYYKFEICDLKHEIFY